MKKSSPASAEVSPNAPERDATAAEMRALGHPLRWRILRATLDKAMTNKELAVRLGRDPGTTLYHVRVLVEHGFLAAEAARTSGKRGAHEIPYRATGKSWRIRVKPSAGNTAAILDAVREEVVEMGDGAAVSTLRLGVKLLPEDLAELRRRISELGDEFESRGDPSGEPVGLLAVVHRRRP
jgi:DNA-binding transcriptional ArsR family regulator